MNTAFQRPALRALLLSGLFALASCAREVPVASPAVPPERKHSWEEAFNRGDADAIAALYAPDGQLLMPGSEPVRGPAAIRAAGTDMIRAGGKVQIGSDQNVGAGDVAYVSGPYRVTNAAGQIAEQGHYVEVWRRTAGVWLITLDLNVPGPAPAPAPAPAQQ